MAEKNVNIFKKEFQLKNVYRGKQTVNRIKSKLIPAIALHLETRMESFKDPIFCAFSIADHTQWDLSDPDYGKNHIANISEHFSEPLSFHNFSKDMAIYEWQGLLKLVTTKYQHFSNSLMLWQQIFKYHNEKFPHILLVIELVLVSAFSSSTVERGISTLNRELTSTRASLKNSTLDDLLLLRINLPILLKCDPTYEQKLVEKATSIYQEAKNRRICKPKTKFVEMAGELEDNQNMFFANSSIGCYKAI